MSTLAAAADPRLERDAADFRRALSDLIRIYQFRDRDQICCYDISVTQCYALESVVERGPLTLNQLAAELYLDKSTTSRVVDALEKKGYASREPHPENRRSILVAPTAEGSDLYRRIETDLLAQETELLGDFAPEVRQAMIQLVARLSRAASARIDTRGGSCCAVGGRGDGAC